MTQVLIVEDQKMIRESLENLVAQADDLSPAGSLSCAALAEQYCMRGNIDLILMDCYLTSRIRIFDTQNTKSE